MENILPQFAVTFGRLDFFAVQDNDDGLETVFIRTVDEVKAMASQFIHVIPDDLEDYQQTISEWTGRDRLQLQHQDDDTFYFSAVPIKLTSDLTQFHNFVRDFNHDYSEDEEA